MVCLGRAIGGDLSFFEYSQDKRIDNIKTLDSPLETMTSSEFSKPSEVEQKRSLWPIFILAIVFLAPMVAAYFWVPTRFVNYGELVVPPRPISNVPLARLSGESLNFSSLKGKWTLLVLDSGFCSDICKKTVHSIHQIRHAQAKNSRRLQLALIVREYNDALGSFLAKYPDIIGLTGKANAIQSMIEQVSIDQSNQPLERSGRVYVIDPAGNFMMYYKENADANLIWKDLRRLLKVSQMG